MLLSSVLALAGGDISVRCYGCAHMAADDLFRFTGNRDTALQRLANHLREQLKDGPSSLPNTILATIFVLCYYELKWPETRIWTLHLKAIRTVI